MIILNWSRFIVFSLTVLPLAAQQYSDPMGFRWDFRPDGSINDGTNDTFDGGNYLTVNGSRFSTNTANEIAPDVLRFGPRRLSKGLTIHRTVLNVKNPVVIAYVETFINEEATPQSVQFSLDSNMGGSPGAPQSTSDKKSGIVSTVIPQSSSRSSVVYLFGQANGKFLPAEIRANSDNISIRFPQFELQPGETKSFLYVMAQRRNPADAFALLKQRSLFSEVVGRAQGIEKFDFLNAVSNAIFSFGDLEVTPPAKSDLVETRLGDVAFGEILTTEFTLQSSRGSTPLKLGEIINVIGSGSSEFTVVTTAGEILKGSLKPERIRLNLSDGAEGEVMLRDVTRLVPKAQANMESDKPESWFRFESPLFQMRSGERMAGTLVASALELHTAIGTLQLPVERLSVIDFGDETETATYQVSLVTEAGERFSGVLYQPFEIETRDGNLVSLLPQRLRVVYFQAKQPEEIQPPPNRSVLYLGPEEFVVTSLVPNEEGVFELNTAFGSRRIEASSIATLAAHREIPGRIKVSLWDGTELSGNLKQQELAFKLFDQTYSIRANAVYRFVNPLAKPPGQVSKQYEKWIQELDHEDFEVRKRAYDSLQEVGGSIQGLLRNSMEGASPELRLSLERLLGGEKED